MYRILLIVFMAILAGQDTFAQSVQPATSPDSVYKVLKYRNIGPFRGGRSVSATGVIGDPTTYYMGTTGGGLWKTEDAGSHWKNISDGYFKTGSVGAIAVAESNPNILYCGMGEHAPRAVMTSHGDGVYKSIDAGKTWMHMGLEKTMHISRIVIDPRNPDIVLVAAQGALYGKSVDRGIYKTVDGGKNWKKVLYVNDLTGCAELSMDMNTPNVIYAAMWEHQRLPWKVISGGEGSGLYKSTDGGDTWKKIHKGLPKEMGKMAIVVSRANSDKVYALIESDSEKEQGGLFVSNDAGKSWSLVTKDHRLVQRAWYYIEVFADPTDENTIYVMSAPALKSIDGGKTWTRITGTHGDYHDLWINPNNPKNLCIANDGGAAISFNQGKSWSSQDIMPTAQFYRLNVDNHFPYRIYAGQQDNSSVRIESRAIGSSSIDATNWTSSAGGESAFLAFDPDSPTHVLGGSYLGTIEVLDTRAKAGTNIMAAPIQYLGRDAKDMKYRYNWNAPIIWSQHESNTYYHGAQLLLRTRDLGVTWEEVSPDLTRNEIEKQGKGGGPYTNEAVGAENYGTLAYVVESPHEAGVIWTGSDDGYVQLTKDGGKTWSNVTPKGLEECLINMVEVSPHDPATAYIATTQYKFNDHKPAIYKTTDYGKSWKNITGNIPGNAFTRVIREDEVRKDMLVVGTELGVYISWNGGTSWEPLQLNLPVTPVLDLLLKHDDIIIATSGRSFWILDDLGLLRQHNAIKEPIKLYKPEDAYIVNGGSQLNSTNEDFDGTDPLTGVNPANGVVVYYELPKLEKEEHVQLEIRNSAGQLINSYSSQKDSTYVKYDGGPSATPTLSKKKGLNRFVWNMRHKTMVGAPKAYIEGSFNGHKAIPGAYTFTLTSGNIKKTTNAALMANPLYPTTAADYKAYDEFMSTGEANVSEMHTMVNQLHDLTDKLKEVIKAIPSTEANKALIKDGQELIKELTAWDEDMIQRKSKAYDDVENFPNKFTANYLFVINHTESAIPKVNQPSRDVLKELDTQWQTLKSRGEALRTTKIPAYNKALYVAGIGALWSK